MKIKKSKSKNEKKPQKSVKNQQENQKVKKNHVQTLLSDLPLALPDYLCSSYY